MYDNECDCDCGCGCCDVVSVGRTVPNFELETFDPAKNEFGKLSLEGLLKEKKWTILVFYPADFTFVCPTELADVAEKYEELKKLGAEVIGVSTDNKYVHMAWQREEKLLQKVKFPMAADTTGNVSRLFGVIRVKSVKNRHMGSILPALFADLVIGNR